MEEKTLGQLKIRFANGEEHIYEYERADPSNPVVGKLIQEGLQSRLLILNLEEGTLFIPFENIVSFEVSPQPVKIPAIAIKKAHRIK